MEARSSVFWILRPLCDPIPLYRRRSHFSGTKFLVVILTYCFCWYSPQLYLSYIYRMRYLPVQLMGETARIYSERLKIPYWLEIIEYNFLQIFGEIIHNSRLFRFQYKFFRNKMIIIICNFWDKWGNIYSILFSFFGSVSNFFVTSKRSLLLNFIIIVETQKRKKIKGNNNLYIYT